MAGGLTKLRSPDRRDRVKPSRRARLPQSADRASAVPGGDQAYCAQGAHGREGSAGWTWFKWRRASTPRSCLGPVAKRLGKLTRSVVAPSLPIRRGLSREPIRLDRRSPRADSSHGHRSEHLAPLAICWRGFAEWRFGLDRRLLRDRCAHHGRSDCWRSRPGARRFPPRSRLTSRDGGGPEHVRRQAEDR